MDGGERSRLARSALIAVIALNALWVVGSMMLLVSGWVAPNAMGTAFVLVMAAAVGGLAVLQALGLRRVAEPVAA